MIDAYELLRVKETNLARVRKEVDSLRVVAKLLSEPDENEALQMHEDGRRQAIRLASSEGNEDAQRDETVPHATAPLFQLTKQNSEESSPKPRRFRLWLGRSVGE